MCVCVCGGVTAVIQHITHTWLERGRPALSILVEYCNGLLSHIFNKKYRRIKLYHHCEKPECVARPTFSHITLTERANSHYLYVNEKWNVFWCDEHQCVEEY